MQKNIQGKGFLKKGHRDHKRIQSTYFIWPLYCTQNEIILRRFDFGMVNYKSLTETDFYPSNFLRSKSIKYIGRNETKKSFCFTNPHLSITAYLRIFFFS